MTTAQHTLAAPVELVIPSPAAPVGGGGSQAVARVCAIIVTWNRKDFVTTVLKALSKQTYSMRNVDVVVVDNAGTDGTLEHLIASFNPERVVDNDTERAHEPKFGSPRVRVGGAGTNAASGNTLGLASLSIVRNSANMGGCGGFNTGFAFVEHWFGKAGMGGPDFVWLVDDDIDLPTDTLEHLTKTMNTDASIGLVGSRTCDLNDRGKTIETTIYFNDRNGCMQDDAPEHHRNHAKHVAWASSTGGTKGRHAYTGTMDVDVVSACSMLARWSAVLGGGGDEKRKGVGFWDARYFIYCDDADWCLRFARAGWRVVLSLDAVVYHTPWNLKLTPARIYYANRNRLWMAQKVLPTERLREVTTTTLRGIMKDAMHAAMHRRAFHSRLIMQTATDVVDNVGGKTGSDGPAALPVIDALREAGALRKDATVAVLCNQRDSVQWFAALGEHVKTEAKGDTPRLIPVVRNDVPGAPADGEGGAVVYGKRLRSRLKKQLRMLSLRPRACVVWDSNNDFPIWTGTSFTLHIDTRKPTMAQLERDGWGTRLAFIAKWIPAWFRLNRYAATVEPYAGTGRYG